MKTYLSRRIPVVIAAGLALAMLALGFLAALGLRSLAGTASADPAAPNPGHSYNQIELPAGTWTGMDADKVDGLDSTALSLASHDHANLMKIALLKWYEVTSSASFAVGDAPVGVAFDGASIWVTDINRPQRDQAEGLGRCAAGHLPRGRHAQRRCLRRGEHLGGQSRQRHRDEALTADEPRQAE